MKILFVLSFPLPIEQISFPTKQQALDNFTKKKEGQFPFSLKEIITDEDGHLLSSKTLISKRK